MKKECIIPIFLSNISNEKINREEKFVSANDVKDIIDCFLKKVKEKEYYVEVTFYGSNFIMLEEEKQEELLQAVNEYIKQKKVESIRITAKPENINKSILKKLKKYHVKTIELVVQSTNDYILKRSKAGYTYQDIRKSSKLIRRFGFKLGHQISVGMPDATKLDEINTVNNLIKLKTKMVRICPIIGKTDTILEDANNNIEYVPLTLVQAVERTKDIIKELYKNRIDTIGIGIQDSNNEVKIENEDEIIIKKSDNSNFRRLVEDSIWYDAIIEKVKKFNTKVKGITILANSQNIHNIIGQNNMNINKFKEIYEVEVKVKKDEKIKPGKFEIVIDETFTDFLN